MPPARNPYCWLAWKAFVRKGLLPVVAVFPAKLQATVPDFRQAPPMLDCRILARWALEVFKRG